MGNFIDKDDIKTELNTTDTTFNTLLDLLAAAIESMWDELTCRTWYTTTHTEYHRAPERTNKIFLKNYPVTSVAYLYDDPDWEYGAASLISSSDYHTNADNGVVVYDGYFYEGDDNIKIVYTAGYTASNVPAWLKQLLVRQACHWFEQAKNKRWHVSSESHPGGGTISYSQLKDNLLPEFMMLAGIHKPVNM